MYLSIYHYIIFIIYLLWLLVAVGFSPIPVGRCWSPACCYLQIASLIFLHVFLCGSLREQKMKPTIRPTKPTLHTNRTNAKPTNKIQYSSTPKHINICLTKLYNIPMLRNFRFCRFVGLLFAKITG